MSPPVWEKKMGEEKQKAPYIHCVQQKNKNISVFFALALRTSFAAATPIDDSYT
jgi:hypothetical protein